MNMIAVDDERLALMALEEAIKTAAPRQAMAGFTSAEAALAHAAQNAPDVAFIDIEMGGMNGLELAKKLKELNGGTNIIFVTGHPQYAPDAFLMRASGYLRKPVTPADITAELNNLRHPAPNNDKRIRIQCFGNFEIFAQGRPVHFHRSKAKEVLAYLTHKRGAAVSKKELAAVLWEDAAYTRSTQSHLQTLIAELMRALKEAGAAHIITKRWNELSLDTGAVECDYYNFIKGDAKAVNSYQGEYMASYSWAEFMLGLLGGKNNL